MSEEAINKFFISIIKANDWIYDPNHKICNEKKRAEKWDFVRATLLSNNIDIKGKLMSHKNMFRV